MHIVYIGLLLLITCLATQGQQIREIGSIRVPLPGFSNLYVHEGSTDPKEQYSLILSTFNPIPFTRDASYFFRYPGKYLNDLSQVERITLDDAFVWPREPNQTPTDAFGFESISQASGFLVPGKNDGTIDVIDMRDPQNPVKHNIAADPTESRNWFYHRVIWKDMNGDGRKDAVTLRARIQAITGRPFTEMLWYEHPASGVFDGPWKRHILNENIGDTFMVETRLRAGGQDYDAIITVGYFVEKLAVHWTTHPDGLWTDLSYVQSHIIDQALGDEKNFFDAVVEDLNLDGKPDLLVSINSETNGTLWVYEIPDDFRTGEYTKHLIADEFFSQSGLGGGGSPGSPGVFYPNKDTTGRPWIFISADDQGAAYYFTPIDKDWDYNMVKFLDTGAGNIVGKITAADFDGDGNTELFVPVYTQSNLRVYTFDPK